MTRLMESSNKERMALIDTLQMQHEKGINTTQTAARAHYYQAVNDSIDEMHAQHNHVVPENVKKDVYDQMDRMEQFELEKLKVYCWDI